MLIFRIEVSFYTKCKYFLTFTRNHIYYSIKRKILNSGEEERIFWNSFFCLFLLPTNQLVYCINGCFYIFKPLALVEMFEMRYQRITES